MYALTPMFPNMLQEWYYASTMEYPWLSQAQFSSPTINLPSSLYPLVKSDETKNDQINFHYHSMSLSPSNNGQEAEQEVGGMILEKKLSHNASERYRRRKLNALYSSLRALLPPSDQKGKKLSIPMTISRVVKYIPEQRQEIQRLSKRKEAILKRISRQTSTLNHHQEHRMRNRTMDSSSQHIIMNWLTDTEVAVQIATKRLASIPDMLLRLEANRVSVISVSSVSSTARKFCTLHLQMREDCRVRLEELNGMLLGLYK